MSKKAQLDKADVASLIERFIAGDVGRWEWDDFVSTTHSDPDVEAIKMRALTIEETFPAEFAGEWCSEQGRRELLKMAEAILR